MVKRKRSSRKQPADAVHFDDYIRAVELLQAGNLSKADAEWWNNLKVSAWASMNDDQRNLAILATQSRDNKNAPGENKSTAG
jgi:hypothetical protein